MKCTEVFGKRPKSFYVVEKFKKNYQEAVGEKNSDRYFPQVLVPI